MGGLDVLSSISEHQNASNSQDDWQNDVHQMILWLTATTVATSQAIRDLISEETTEKENERRRENDGKNSKTEDPEFPTVKTKSAWSSLMKRIDARTQRR